MNRIFSAGRRTVLSLLLASVVAWQESPCAADSQGSIRFREVSADWNAQFRHHSGAAGDFYMIETLGSGVVLFDYDGDGDPDLLYVDSGTVPGYQGDEPRTRLLRNDGIQALGGRTVQTFVDVTEVSGIVVTSYGMGATAGDVDGDGDLDLYVTAWGPNHLFLNQGDGTFVDASVRAGVAVPTWSASAGFADADGDGDLDLYVTDYVDFSWDNNPVCGVREKGRRSYCHPDVYAGMPDHLFRGRGDGTFEGASEQAGITHFEDGQARLGKGLGVVWSDLDGNGAPDVYVANDMTPNFHFSNLGDGAFEEIAVLVGTAVSHLGHEEAGMGVDAADFDSDGHLDLFVTHLDLQTNAFYGNLGGGLFVDRRFVTGVAEASMLKVGFGTDFADLDNDGDLDLAVANGHIVHNVEEWGTGTTYKQENQLFENEGGKYLRVQSSGVDLVRSSRGLATGDLDADGDLDLVVTNSNDDAEVYENLADAGGWLQVDIRTDLPGNRQGIGAKVYVRTGSLTQLREVRTASSYLSQNPLTVHYGLGEATPEELRVRWPWIRHRPARELRVRGLQKNVRARVSLKDPAN
ncbi:MAG: CRTAC1 family protein [Thermoanaerobaculia bacterium]|nr:CRTAC1 family protein [Thermoanaerobaculia bacterium]